MQSRLKIKFPYFGEKSQIAKTQRSEGCSSPAAEAALKLCTNASSEISFCF